MFFPIIKSLILSVRSMLQVMTNAQTSSETDLIQNCKLFFRSVTSFLIACKCRLLSGVFLDISFVRYASFSFLNISLLNFVTFSWRDLYTCSKRILICLIQIWINSWESVIIQQYLLQPRNKSFSFQYCLCLLLQRETERNNSFSRQSFIIL